MIKSTITLARTGNGWSVLEAKLVLATFATKREARTFLRQARAADRTARAYLLGRETTAGHCDSRCTSAVGTVCVCACMGANHSADLAA